MEIFPGGADKKSVDARSLLKIGHFLSDPMVWAEPPPTVRAAVFSAIEPHLWPAPSTAPAPRASLLRRWRTSAVSALVGVAVTAVVGIVVYLPDGQSSTTHRAVTLKGTALAPEATAEARIKHTQSGVELLLNIHRLPPAGPDEYYQGWLKGPAGSVTVGTFHMRGESERVVLWSGVEIEEYPTMTVTLQKKGAGPKSSGMVYLAGDTASELLQSAH